MTTLENRQPLALLGATLALGTLGAVLFDGSFGLNAPLFAIAAAGTFLLLTRGRPGTTIDRVLLASLVLWPLTVAWRGSPELTAMALAAELLTLYLAYLRAGLGSLARLPITSFTGSAGPALRFATKAPRALAREDMDWAAIRGAGQLRVAGAAARGLLLSIPMVIVFGALFSSADGRFESLAAWFLDVDAEAVVRTTLAFVASAWVAIACLRPGVLGAPVEIGATVDDWNRPGPIEVLVVLVILDILFASYVAVQFTYFFGGDVLVREAGSLTYAGYARRGFFELAWVATLSLCLLLAADWAMTDADRRYRRALRVLAGLMIAMVVVMELSAAHRMALYADAFGLTVLRFFTSVFMVWLLVLLGWFAATVLRGDRHRFLSGAIASGLALVGILILANPDALIARTNVERAVDTRQLDVGYLLELSADATPVLVETLRDARLPRHARLALGKALRDRARSLQGHGWRDFNLARWQEAGLLTGASRSNVGARRGRLQ